MQQTSLPKCVGVDGAKHRWLAVFREGQRLAMRVHESAMELCGQHGDAAVIAVDIPMGLSADDRRAADVEARKFVGGHRSPSIFSAPVRGILDSASQQDASTRHRKITGRGFGVQGFAMLPKIREWDGLLRSSPYERQRVYEAHPEVSFAALKALEDGAGFACGYGLRARKKSEEGHKERKRLLAGAFGEDAVEELLRQREAATAAADDVLDALAALWTAERIASGEAHSLPGESRVDSEGLRVAIYY